MKLVSMTDYVLSQEKKGLQNTDRHLRFESILRYAKFLSQPLTLGMFVPCDLDGNVIKLSEEHKKEPNNWSPCEIEWYKKAKERVLFANVSYSFDEIYRVFEIEHGDVCIYYDVENDQFISDSVSSDVVLIEVECLSDMIKKSNKDIRLTESAIKQL